MIVASPQTPSRRKSTKLNIDIPSGYSNPTSGPASPVSQFMASPAFSPTSIPSSPTFSGVFNSNRTQAELTVLLKEAYGVIKDKERDLTLAAEIGKSLLENNIALKSKYESAIVQLQHLQRQRSKAATFTIHQIGDNKNVTQMAPPSNSLENISDDFTDCDESDSESLQGWSSSLDMSSPTTDMPIKRKNHQNSSGLSYKDLENIKDLESRNQQLQQQLEEALKEQEGAEKSNKSKIRKLESDLEYFQEVCKSATQKFEDLEKENERLAQKAKADFWNLKYSKKSNENDDFIETLLQKVQELEEQNSLVEKTKSEIERKLQRTTTELDALNKERSELMEKTKDFEMLQLENHQKEIYISELNENLEQQRALVTSYRSGCWSGKTSRANSISDGGGFMSNAIRRLSDADRSLFGISPKQSGQDNGGIGGKIKKSLLSELENEWFRELTIFQRDNKDDSASSSPNFSPIGSEKDLNDFFLTNGARDDDMDYLSDDEFSFLEEFDVDNEKAHRLREWFFIRWTRAVYRFIRRIWRWCRFIVILIAAVLMALYRGPDDILPNDIYY